MSYNLLLSTNFNKPNLNHWKLTNCEWKNGILISQDTIYSIEQELILPKATKLYFSIDYVCFDSNIKSIYCGIESTSGELEAVKKKPQLKKRKKLSVINNTGTEKIKVVVIVEAKVPFTRIYLDSPLLVDLNANQLNSHWPKYFLDKYLDYRYGFEYSNEYSMSEIQIDSQDFHSPYTKTEKGKAGIIATASENDWFKISHTFTPNTLYLVKLDYEDINSYGEIYFSYGETTSINIDNKQIYIIFKAKENNTLNLNLKSFESLPYQVNLKHIMVINTTGLNLGEEDIPYLPFI